MAIKLNLPSAQLRDNIQELVMNEGENAEVTAALQEENEKTASMLICVFFF